MEKTGMPAACKTVPPVLTVASRLCLSLMHAKMKQKSTMMQASVAKAPNASRCARAAVVLGHLG